MVTFRAPLSGTVDDYDEAAKAAMRARIAVVAGVTIDAVTLTLMASSVSMLVEVTTESRGQAQSVMVSLEPRLADPSTASALLQAPVEAISPLQQRTSSSAKPGDVTGQAAPLSFLESSASAWDGAIPLGASLASVIAMALLALLCCRRRRVRQRKRGAAQATACAAPTMSTAHTVAVERPSLMAAPYCGSTPLPEPHALPPNSLWRCSVTALPEAAPLPPTAPLPPARRAPLAPLPPAGRFNEWEWPSDGVVWGRRLGRGSFGSVYVVETSGLRLAAKCIEVDETEREQSLKSVRREALALRSLTHPNIVETLGLISDRPSYVAILMELADFGSLRAILDAPHASVLLSHPQAQMRAVLDVAKGMAYLHGQAPPILHHDLKSANILVFGRGPSLDSSSVLTLVAKLCDFGMVSGLGNVSSTLQSTRVGGGGAGTLAYTAPEAFDDRYGAPAEVYAYGIIVWEVLTGQVPWASNPATSKPYTHGALVRAVMSGERPPLPGAVDGAGASDGPVAARLLAPLAARCWVGDPASRPLFDRSPARSPLACASLGRWPSVRCPWRCLMRPHRQRPQPRWQSHLLRRA